ncbi:MAG: hypothetical protein HQ581_03105 [Planctomycetes bacterium]|nr:hypothetical protein [Planctomycetota bacterium]
MLVQRPTNRLAEAFAGRAKEAGLSMAVSQLGLNRIRLELYGCVENPVDVHGQFLNGQISYEEFKTVGSQKINDNNDPNIANPRGFHFTFIDYQIDNMILPMKRKLKANGESIRVNLCLVDFNNGKDGKVSNMSLGENPAEYAELVLETFEHMRNKYGFAPDALEIVNEPNNCTDWRTRTGAKVGTCMIAAVKRLTENGFTLKEVVGPSSAEADRAIADFDQMIQVPGVSDLLTTFSYHKYSGTGTAANRQAILTRAQTHNLKTAMTEHWHDDHAKLMDDLQEAHITYYQRWAYAAPHKSTYIRTDVTDPANPVFTLHDQVRAMPQVFKYVRDKAVQIEVTSGDAAAYINQDGRYAVIIQNATQGPHEVIGLPAGVYGITSSGRATGGYLIETSSPDVTIKAGETLTFRVATTGGLITVFTKSTPGAR